MRAAALSIACPLRAVHARGGAGPLARQGLRLASTGAGTNAFGSRLPAVLESSGWDGAWRAGVTPWETGAAAPCIPALLDSGVLPAAGDVLVPGSGSGADALEFARRGRRTLGLDLSLTAVELAQQRQRDSGVARSTLRFLAGDFFTAAVSLGSFGVVFDYTLLSALPPAMWPAWAAAMRSLVSPDG
jgi:SAM-dependent methyltransferase